MRRMRIALVIVVGSVVVFGLPVGAMAADDAAIPSRLTIGGQPLDRLVRTEPLAPFVAFKPGVVGVNPHAVGAGQTSAVRTGRGSRTKKMLIGGAIGAGTGWFLGYAACANEGGGYFCDYSAMGLLSGLGVGLGLGALFGN